MGSFPQQTTAVPNLRRSHSSAISFFHMGSPVPVISSSLTSRSALSSLPIDEPMNPKPAMHISENNHTTPLRRALPFARMPEQFLSPQKAQDNLESVPSTPRTPSLTGRNASFTSTSPHSPSVTLQSGAGSPLLAIQFMRKAADSPNVREKEKDKFAAKRSSPNKEKSKTNLSSNHRTAQAMSGKGKNLHTAFFPYVDMLS